MKKFSFIMLLSLSVLLLFSCKDNETGPGDTSTDGYKINLSITNDYSEMGKVENDTISIRKRVSIGVTSPKFLTIVILFAGYMITILMGIRSYYLKIMPQFSRKMPSVNCVVFPHIVLMGKETVLSK